MNGHFTDQPGQMFTISGVSYDYAVVIFVATRKVSILQCVFESLK